MGHAYPAHPAPRSSEGAQRPIADRPARSSRRRGSADDFLRLMVTVLCISTLIVMSPLWAPLLLAGWTAILVASPHQRLANKLGGSRRSAAALTVAFVVILIVPLVLVTISLVGGAVELAKNVIAAGGGLDAMRALFSGGSGAKFEARIFDRLFELAQ